MPGDEKTPFHVERIGAVAWRGVKLGSIRPAGFEPATDGLEIRCSIQLSYGRNSLQSAWRYSRPAGVLHSVELRPAGLEPATCGLGNRRSIHLSYERDILTRLILRHGRVCCQRVCDSLARKRSMESCIRARRLTESFRQ
jgi:hypothetical protein